MNQDSGPRRRPQYSLARLLLAMAVVGTISSAGYYLARAEPRDGGMQLAGVLVLLCAPSLLVVILSVALTALGRIRPRR
jgi:hypothetical protein